MRTVTFYIAAALLFGNSLAPLSAQEISRQEQFFYIVKLYGPGGRSSDVSIASYGVTFDAANYRNSRDEFSRAQYRRRIAAVIDAGVEAIDFTERFTVTGRGTLGEYDFARQAFPITSWNFDIKRSFDRPGDIGYWFELATSSAINLRDFHGSIAMTDVAAEAFVGRRRTSTGAIDRTVYLRTTYSILNRTSRTPSNSYYFRSYIHSIEVFEDNLLTRRLAIIRPAIEYEDKVHGIQRLNDQRTIYYENRYESGRSDVSINKHNELPTREGARYYRVVDYVDGRIAKVADYYITGELEMEGRFDPYCFDPWCANGLFTWYYQSGSKRREATLVNGEVVGRVLHWPDQPRPVGRTPSAPSASAASATSVQSGVAELPPDAPMGEVEAWIESVGPSMASDYVLTRGTTRVQFRSKMESAALSECLLTLRFVFEEETTTARVTMGDVDTRELRPRVYDVREGWTANSPSYFVPLLALADRGRPFSQESSGTPAGSVAKQGPANLIYVKVRDLDMATRVAAAFRRAAVLCGAP